jgi:hypothetical protein
VNATLVQVQRLDPKTLKPYPRNNKLHDSKQIDKLAESIENFGFDVPIVVDSDMVIIKGHARHQASLKLDLPDVPVIVRGDLTEEQVKAARIADNKLAECDWDLDNLIKEFDDLKDSDFLELTAFDPQEIDKIISGFGDEEEEEEDDSGNNGNTQNRNKVCKCPKCGYEY